MRKMWNNNLAETINFAKAFSGKVSAGILQSGN